MQSSLTIALLSFHYSQKGQPLLCVSFRLHPKPCRVPATANDGKGHSLGTGQGHDRMPSVGANYSDVTKLRLIQGIL